MEGIKQLVNEAIIDWVSEIKRSEMPQVKNKEIPEILELFNKHDIKYKEGIVECGELKPTQEDFIPDKVKSMVKKMKSGEWEDTPIFISKEGCILDGHHRWVAYKECYGDNHKIKVIDVDLPQKEALSVFSVGAEKVNEVKLGDKVRITTARTSGSKAYDIIVTKIVNKNKVKGQVLTGNEAGMTVTGNIIKEEIDFQKLGDMFGADITKKDDIIDVRLLDITEIKGNKIIAVYPGRFQPFHSGHYYSYEAMVKKFGEKNVYVATSDKVEPGKSPFNFSEKKLIMNKMFGIPMNKIVKAKNLYNNMSYKNLGDIDNDILVIGLGEKDSGRRIGKYYKKYTDGTKEPFGKNGYVYSVPQKPMKINGKVISGSIIRQVFQKGSDKVKRNLFKKIYGKFDEKIYNLITKKINESIILPSVVIEEFLIHRNFSKIISEATQAGDAQVDDGPATFYTSPDAYKHGKLNVKQKSMEEVIEQLGWQVVDWLAGETDEYVGQRYRYELVGDVSFGDVGNRDSDYSDPVKKYQEFMTRVANRVGYSVVDWLLDDDKKNNIIDDPKKEMALQEPLQQNTDNASEPIDENIIKENPDEINIDGLENHWGASDSRTFGFYKNKAYATNTGGLVHSDIAYYMYDGGEIDEEEYEELPNDRPDFDYPGRLWLTDKIILFWEYPKENKLKNLISKLEKLLKIKIWNNGWKIEVIDRGGKIYKITKKDVDNYDLWKKQASRAIPIEDYIGSQKQVGKEVSHQKSPGLKKKKKVPSGIGSKKYLAKKPLKYRQALQRDDINKTGNLLTDTKYSDEPLDYRELLLCGGAYGHIEHIFDDWNLTFGDLSQLIDKALDGKLELVSEKTDGQQLSVTWKDGRLRAARNKSHLKNQGDNSLTREQVSDMFSGRGEIQDAFVFAMEDLEKAISKLSDKDKESIFDNGKKFMSLEVIYPATENTVPYGTSLLLFHSAIEYDDSGSPIGEHKADAKKLSDMIKKVNENIQKHFEIGDVPIISLPKSKDFSTNKTNFMNKLNKLKKEFNLKDSDEVVEYHKKWWEKFILDNASKMKYSLPNDILVKLVNRWAVLDKRSFTVHQIKKEITDSKFRDWVIKFDKTDHKKQMDKNIKPFELLFFELGAVVLRNVSDLLAVNPDKSIQKMKNEIDKTKKELDKSKDPIKLEKFKKAMEKLQAIGGTDVIAPSEGIVFTWKGKVWKLVGTFGPVHQIISLLKF